MIKKELQQELNRTKLVLDYARQEIKDKDKEIDELKAKLEMYENGVYFSSENDKLQEKIDKAIEYIEEKGRLKYKPDELLNILQGNKWNEVERAYLDDKPIGSEKE